MGRNEHFMRFYHVFAYSLIYEYKYIWSHMLPKRIFIIIYYTYKHSAILAFVLLNQFNLHRDHNSTLFCIKCITNRHWLSISYHLELDIFDKHCFIQIRIACRTLPIMWLDVLLNTRITWVHFTAWSCKGFVHNHIARRTGQCRGWQRI